MKEWVGPSWGNKKGRERPKITLVEVLKSDMSITGLTKSMTLR